MGKLKNVIPNVEHLRPFGCVSMMFIDQHKRETNLSPRSRSCLMMGYDDKRVGYRPLSLETGQIVTARH